MLWEFVFDKKFIQIKLKTYGSFEISKLLLTLLRRILKPFGSCKYRGTAGKSLNPSPAWWPETLLSKTALALIYFIFSGIFSYGNMHMYVQILKVFSVGFVLQWKDLESKRIKSPAFVLTFKWLQNGS